KIPMRNTKLVIITILFAIFSSYHLAAQGPENEKIKLWDSKKKYPLLSEIPQVKNVTYSVVHKQTQDYQFLHEPRLAFHDSKLFVSFSHAPLIESEPAQLMHGKRSADFGK